MELKRPDCACEPITNLYDDGMNYWIVTECPRCKTGYRTITTIAHAEKYKAIRAAQDKMLAEALGV